MLQGFHLSTIKNTDMQLLTPTHFSEYELIDSGGFEKLERFGKYVLIRPEPQAIWSGTTRRRNANTQRSMIQILVWPQSIRVGGGFRNNHGSASADIRNPVTLGGNGFAARWRPPVHPAKLLGVKRAEPCAIARATLAASGQPARYSWCRWNPASSPLGKHQRHS